jgi:hypothetical protein
MGHLATGDPLNVAKCYGIILSYCGHLGGAEAQMLLERAARALERPLEL